MTASNVDLFDPEAKQFETNETVYVNTTKTWQFFAETMKSAGVKPIQALWHIGSMCATQAFVEMRLFEEPLYCKVVLPEGHMLAGHPGTVQGMQALLVFLPQNANWQWSVMSYGGNLFPIAAAAMERGGHVSIGLGTTLMVNSNTPQTRVSSHGSSNSHVIWAVRLQPLQRRRSCWK